MTLDEMIAAFPSIVDATRLPARTRKEDVSPSLEGLRILVVQSGAGGARGDFTSPSPWKKVR